MARSAEEIKKDIESGNTALGIEIWFDPNQGSIDGRHDRADRAGEL